MVEKKKNNDVLVVSFIPEQNTGKNNLRNELYKGLEDSSHSFEPMIIRNKYICKGKAFHARCYTDTSRIINQISDKMAYADNLIVTAQFYLPEVKFSEIYSSINLSPIFITTTGKQGIIIGYIPFNKLPLVSSHFITSSDAQVTEVLEKISTGFHNFNNKKCYFILTINDELIEREAVEKIYQIGKGIGAN